MCNGLGFNILQKQCQPPLIGDVFLQIFRQILAILELRKRGFEYGVRNAALSHQFWVILGQNIDDDTFLVLSVEQVEHLHGYLAAHGMSYQYRFIGTMFSEEVMQEASHGIVGKHIRMETPAMVRQVGNYHMIAAIRQKPAYVQPMAAHAQPTVYYHQRSSIKRTEFSVK